MAERKNFVIEQGVTFDRSVYYLLKDRTTPIVLDGLDAKMTIRNPLTGSTVLDLTSNPAAGITITSGEGKLDIRIGADVTGDLDPDTPLVYNLDLVETADATQVVRLFQGAISVAPETLR